MAALYAKQAWTLYTLGQPQTQRHRQAPPPPQRDGFSNILNVRKGTGGKAQSGQHAPAPSDNPPASGWHRLEAHCMVANRQGDTHASRVKPVVICITFERNTADVTAAGPQKQHHSAQDQQRSDSHASAGEAPRG